MPGESAVGDFTRPTWLVMSAGKSAGSGALIHGWRNVWFRHSWETAGDRSSVAMQPSNNTTPEDVQRKMKMYIHAKTSPNVHRNILQ